jgi:hypothetical protein
LRVVTVSAQRPRRDGAVVLVNGRQWLFPSRNGLEDIVDTVDSVDGVARAGRATLQRTGCDPTHRRADE